MVIILQFRLLIFLLRLEFFIYIVLICGCWSRLEGCTSFLQSGILLLSGGELRCVWFWCLRSYCLILSCLECLANGRLLGSPLILYYLSNVRRFHYANPLRSDPCHIWSGIYGHFLDLMARFWHIVGLDWDFMGFWLGLSWVKFTSVDRGCGFSLFEGCSHSCIRFVNTSLSSLLILSLLIVEQDWDVLK